MIVTIFGKICILFSLQGDNRLVLRVLCDIGTKVSHDPRVPGSGFYCMLFNLAQGQL